MTAAMSSGVMQVASAADLNTIIAKYAGREPSDAEQAAAVETFAAMQSSVAAAGQAIAPFAALK